MAMAPIHVENVEIVEIVEIVEKRLGGRLLPLGRRDYNDVVLNR